MGTSMSRAGRSAHYTIPQAAWLLGVSRERVSRAVRVGTVRAVQRRSALVIPASQLARLLDGGEAR